MALNNNDQTRVREYLLGKLNEDDEQKLEERLMVENDLFEEFEISKGELIEEYRADELSKTERQFFEQHYLACPDARDRYELTFALDHLKAPEPLPPPRRVSLIERLTNLFKQRPLLISTAASLATIAIVAFVALWPVGVTVAGPTLAINLINRGENTLPTKVTIPANANALKFPLLLPRDVTPAQNYRAELDNRTKLTPVTVAEHDQTTVWVVVPVRQIPRGQYSLKLTAISASGEEREIPGDYLFYIE